MKKLFNSLVVILLTTGLSAQNLTVTASQEVIDCATDIYLLPYYTTTPCTGGSYSGSYVQILALSGPPYTATVPRLSGGVLLRYFEVYTGNLPPTGNYEGFIDDPDACTNNTIYVNCDTDPDVVVEIDYASPSTVNLNIQ